MIQIGHKLYERCQYCEQVIRINKPLFGSLHICLTQAEIDAKYGRPNRSSRVEGRGETHEAQKD
jgi:hypothetical protein